MFNKVYSSSGIIQYSYGEQATGQFSPEGYPLYRQAYVLPAMVAAGGSQNIALNATIGSHFSFVGGHVVNQNTGNFHPLPYTNVENTIYQVSMEMLPAKTDMLVGYGTGFHGGAGAFVIEYTKL